MSVVFNNLDQYNNFSETVYSISVHLKSQIEKSSALNALELAKSKFPNMNQSKINEKKLEYGIINSEGEINEQMFFSLNGLRNIVLLWGHSINPAPSIDDFSGLLKAIGISTITIEYIDFKVINASRWSGNHYEIINDAFYNHDTVGKLNPDNAMISETSLTQKGSLNNDGLRYFIKVSSDVSHGELLSGDFKNDSLQASLGIACIDININQDIITHLKSITENADAFLNNNFANYIISPLNESIERANSANL